MNWHLNNMSVNNRYIDTVLIHDSLENATIGYLSRRSP